MTETKLCTGGSGRCGRKVHARGLCRTHYNWHLKGKSTKGALRGYREVGRQLTPPRVSDEVGEAVDAACQRQGISEYEFMRRLVEDWYERTKGNDSTKP